MWLLLLACARPPVAVAPSAPAPQPTVVLDDALLWLARARLAGELGDTAERDRALAWVQRLDDANPWAWVAIARVRLDTDDPAGARAALTTAAARCGDCPAAAEITTLHAALPPP
jgi:IS5 family transposase